MPRVDANSSPWITQRLVLQSRGRYSDRVAVRQQARTIGAHQVHHAFTAPDVPMKPQAAVHGVNHSVAPLYKLARTGRSIEIAESRFATQLV